MLHPPSQPDSSPAMLAARTRADPCDASFASEHSVQPHDTESEFCWRFDIPKSQSIHRVNADGIAHILKELDVLRDHFIAKAGRLETDTFALKRDVDAVCCRLDAVEAFLHPQVDEQSVGVSIAKSQAAIFAVATQAADAAVRVHLAPFTDDLLELRHHLVMVKQSFESDSHPSIKLQEHLACRGEEMEWLRQRLSDVEGHVSELLVLKNDLAEFRRSQLVDVKRRLVERTALQELGTGLRENSLDIGQECSLEAKVVAEALREHVRELSPCGQSTNRILGKGRPSQTIEPFWPNATFPRSPGERGLSSDQDRPTRMGTFLDSQPSINTALLSDPSMIPKRPSSAPTARRPFKSAIAGTSAALDCTPNLSAQALSGGGSAWTCRTDRLRARRLKTHMLRAEVQAIRFIPREPNEEPERTPGYADG